MNDSMLLRQLMDLLPDALFIKDAEGKFILVNRTLAGWYGLADPDLAVGKSEADFTPKEFAQATREAERKILDGGTPLVDQESKIVGADGRDHWIATTKMPLRNDAGEVVGLIGISRDIKGVRNAEEAARDSDALYRSLIEALPQCIFRKDAEGRYVYVNQRLCELHGITPQEFVGKTDFDVNPSELAWKYRRDDQWVMAHEKAFEAVEEVKGKRKLIRIQIHKTPVYDAQGRVVGVQGVFYPLPEVRVVAAPKKKPKAPAKKKKK
ncbi:MAG: PAS domain S-box protein [Planctomycetota bacterium]|nr:MAG: PAS domain S-box protein [Planctomycetota bacterium]